MKTFEPVLCHHGILGMKWGIRRYQNKDGSLTYKGKIRNGQKSITLPKNQMLLRSAKTDSRDFMDRAYTYVSAVDEYYDHYRNVSSDYFADREKIIEMRPKRDLKLASFNDFSDVIIQRYGKDLNINNLNSNDINRGSKFIKELKKDLNYRKYSDGMFGANPIFNSIVSDLANKGFDGMVDPVDGFNQYSNENDDEINKVTAVVIFKPKENLYIKEITNAY